MRPPPIENASESYDRPNQAWLCGQATDGHACPAGPLVNGRCPALADCAPTREGDRWQCNRSALRGGSCDTGPTPEGGCGCIRHCTPVRSLRQARGRFVLASTIATAAALMIVLSADWRDEVLAPGPLAAQHAQLLRREGTPPQCAACHAAAADGITGWTAALLVGHGDRPAQSQLCMNCHDKTIAREHALFAHNVPSEMLKRGTGLFFAGANDLRTPATGNNISDPFSIACAACHREHHGATFDLTAMNNNACQACHQQRYESFATDHPVFDGWPYERRTPIAFDHASHQAKHFRDKNAEFNCQQCHQQDGTGSVQLLTSFAAACATCHNEKIATSFSQGVPMLVLPTLDVAALRAAGRDIGPWPSAATGDFDGRLPPMMKLLLSADPAAANAIAKLGEDFEFFDIDAANSEDLAACADLAIAIKKLLTELSEAGPAAVRARLAAVLQREITDDELNALVGGLSVDTLRPAARAWLAQEALAANQPAGNGAAVAGAWFRDDATLSIRYRPAIHADPILTGWLSLLAGVGDLESKPLALAMFKEMSRPTAPGLCASCHSVEQSRPGRLAIHWRAADRTKSPRAFTKFSHSPHVLLPELADCTACHTIDSGADTSPSDAGWNATAFTSEFRPIAKQSCAACHTAKGAGDSCQQCHNYHVGGIEDSGFGVESLGLKGDILRGAAANGQSIVPNPQASTLIPQPIKTSSDTRPAPR